MMKPVRFILALAVFVVFITAEVVGEVIWFVFVTLPRFLFGLIVPKKLSAADLIERDFAAVKQRMNDMAGQSWRNLVA